MIYSNQQVIAEQDGPLATAVMILRIIVAALAAGLLMFTVVVTVVVPTINGPRPAKAGVPADKAMPVLTVAAVVMAAILLPLSVAIPGIVSDAQRRALARVPASPEDVPVLIQAYQTKLIMAAALTEGPGFFALIVYMLEGNPIALGLGLMMIVFLLMRFPIRARVEQWLDGQLDRLQEERRNVAIG